MWEEPQRLFPDTGCDSQPRREEKKRKKWGSEPKEVKSGSR